MSKSIDTPADIAATASKPSALRKLYRALKKNALVGPVINSAAGFTLEHIWAPELHKSRVANVVNATEFSKIPKVANAGRIQDNKLTMHNGIVVYANSYYDQNMKYVLSRTAGIHEPRQEYLFGEILKTIKPGSTMLELGSYWGFYSMWFQTAVQDAKNVLIEPDPARLESGRKNFSLNGLDATFIQGYVGAEEGPTSDDNTMWTVQGILDASGHQSATIIHADIQGAELDMLKGATQAMSGGHIDYFFLSTHSAELHSQCRVYLEAQSFRIIEDVPGDASDSEDGLLIAQHSRLEPFNLPH